MGLLHHRRSTACQPAGSRLPMRQLCCWPKCARPQRLSSDDWQRLGAKSGIWEERIYQVWLVRFGHWPPRPPVAEPCGYAPRSRLAHGQNPCGIPGAFIPFKRLRSNCYEELDGNNAIMLPIDPVLFGPWEKGGSHDRLVRAQQRPVLSSRRADGSFTTDRPG